MKTRKFLSVTLACIAIASSVAPALAADPYPLKPITIIYPYASGSASDALTRMVGEILHKALGQPVIVESKPGAGGSTALEFVTRAPADGYTLVLSASGTMAVNPHIYNLRYKPVEDLVPITVLVDIPFVVVTNVDFPARNLKEFITQAKARPGAISFGNTGIGTQAHLTQVMLTKAAGIDVNIVGYKGGAPAVNDLMGGHLDAMIDNVAAQVPHIQSRKVNPLFVTSKSRVAAYPNVPTAHEAGLEEFSAVGWFGLAAPKGTPSEIINRLNKALVQGLAQPDIQKRLIDAGWVPVASTPAEATARAKADLAALGTIARLIGLKQN